VITTLYAALLAILYLCLTVYVVRGRYAHKVGIGDGGNPAMARRVRIHGNFAEYAPIALILLFLVDNGGASPITVHILGLMILTGRILHAWGLSQSETTSFGRMAGMILTLTMIGASAIILLWKFIMLQTIAV